MQPFLAKLFRYNVMSMLCAGATSSGMTEMTCREKSGQTDTQRKIPYDARRHRRQLYLGTLSYLLFLVPFEVHVPFSQYSAVSSGEGRCDESKIR
jgi:hypothetical protein